MTDILMPKATAVWLVDNTSLSFEQIADFCGLHPLEVRGIADGDVARDIRGVDPVTGGQLTREELEKAQDNPDYRMKAVVSRHAELLKEYNNGEPERRGDERNAQKYQDRVAGLKASIDRNQADIDGIKRELSRFKQP